jgi:hypothetical protein
MTGVVVFKGELVYGFAAKLAEFSSMLARLLGQQFRLFVGDIFR